MRRGLLPRRAFRGRRHEDAEGEQQREQSSYVQRADQTHVSSDTTAAGWDSTVVVNWNEASVATMWRRATRTVTRQCWTAQIARNSLDFSPIAEPSIQEGCHHSHRKTSRVKQTVAIRRVVRIPGREHLVIHCEDFCTPPPRRTRGRQLAICAAAVIACAHDRVRRRRRRRVHPRRGPATLRALLASGPGGATAGHSSPHERPIP